MRAIVLVGTLLCGACGGGDGGGGQARTVNPTKSSSTAAPRDVALSEVVVQLSDLPTGWSVSPPENEDEADDSFCEGRDPFNEIPPQAEAESSFQQSDFGPFVDSGASLYTDDEASEVMDRLAEMANACQSFMQTEEDGTETTYTTSPLSFPDLGDDTFAFRVSGSTMLGPINLDVAAVREGAIVLFVGNGGLGAADTQLTEQLLRTMLRRL